MIASFFFRFNIRKKPFFVSLTKPKQLMFLELGGPRTLACFQLQRRSRKPNSPITDFRQQALGIL